MSFNEEKQTNTINLKVLFEKEIKKVGIIGVNFLKEDDILKVNLII